MCISPSEETLAISTERGQIYLIALASAEMSKVPWERDAHMSWWCCIDAFLCTDVCSYRTLCLSSGSADSLRVSVSLFSLGDHHRSVCLHPQTAHRHLLHGPLHPHLELRDQVRAAVVWGFSNFCASFVMSISLPVFITGLLKYTVYLAYFYLFAYVSSVSFHGPKTCRLG